MVVPYPRQNTHLFFENTVIKMKLTCYYYTGSGGDTLNRGSFEEAEEITICLPLVTFPD